MTPSLPPVPGWAPGVRAVADAVEASGHRLADAAADLVRLRDGAVWDTPAGEAFGRRVGDVPGLIDRAARRHLGAASALRPWADALEEEQAVAQRCVVEHRAALDRYRVLEDRVWALVSAGRDETDPEVVVLREDQREQMAVVARAEVRHRTATDRLETAADRCAGTLRALADDDVADSALYRGLRSTSTVGHSVGYLQLLKPCPPVAAVGTVGAWTAVGADSALLVGYGEGSWAETGQDAAFAAAGAGGRALRLGATAGVVRRADGAVLRLARLSTQERLLAGASATARERLATARDTLGTAVGRGPRPTARQPAPAAVPGGRVRRLVETGRRRVVATVEPHAADLALATAHGPGAVRMYVGGVSLTAASKVGPHVAPDPDARAPARGTPR